MRRGRHCLDEGAPIAQADELSEVDVKRLALEAIPNNPEVLIQVVEILQSREKPATAAAAGQILSKLRQHLEQDPNALVLGNPEGDGAIVGFCDARKRAAPVVKKVIAGDENVRVVYRERPILGKGPVFAARAAPAADVR